jgi:hypothetical protein
MKRKKSKWSAEFWLAFFALVVGICTMIVYIYQATIMSKQLSASVRPFLITIYSNQESSVSWGIENKGVGPAFIKQTRLWINGEMYDEENHEEFLENLFQKNIQYSYANLNGRVISAGERIKLFEFEDLRDLAFIDSVFQAQNIGIDVCYCSVQDECWSIQSKQATERNVNICK